MTERQEEQAALNALYSLDAHERQILRAELRTDPRLRDLAAELEEVAARVTLLIPAEAPPEDVRSQLLKALKERRRAKAAPVWTPLHILRSPKVAWAVAACLAFLLWIGDATRRNLSQEVAALSESESAARSTATAATEKAGTLEKNLAEATSKSDQLAGELADLKKANVFAKAEIAYLRATVRRFDEGVAVIVWDSEKQEGKLKLEKMPPVSANKDYQLWVIDKKNPAPVSAGLIKVDARGNASVTFKPAEPVPAAAKFAISLETLGGVTKKSADGPIIFTGP